MQKILARIVGIFIISILNIALLAVGSLFLMEWSGLSHRMDRALKLHETAYYGRTALDSDPYRAFVVQHLHPYFLFSLPWRPADRAAANNAVASVDETGFRVSVPSDSPRAGLVVGGSTAFGHYSSSDATTLASVLTGETGIRFHNRAAPSWNSHQEFLALAKSDIAYSVSVSFSLANDMSLFCEFGAQSGVPDQVESFDRLESYFNDIRGTALTPAAAPFSFGVSDLKQALHRYAPKTASVLIKLKSRAAPAPRLVADDVGAGGPLAADYCGGERGAQQVAASFLKNQSLMRMISQARNADHWLVIQPIYELHPGVNLIISDRAARYGQETAIARVAFRKRVVDIVMTSAVCKDKCVDLSTAFSDTPTDDLIYDELRPETYATALFADNVHLTDAGVRRAVDLLKARLGPDPRS